MKRSKNPVVTGRVGRRRLDDFVLDDFRLGETDKLGAGTFDDLHEVSPADSRRRFINFSTTLPLNKTPWRHVFDENPIPGDWCQSNQVPTRLIPQIYDP